jgi:hypothetical protein
MVVLSAFPYQGIEKLPAEGIRKKGMNTSSGF